MDTVVGKDNFRDRISTVDREGKRSWIFAQQPKGKLYKARNILSLVYLILFFTLPFFKINGNPVFLFNVLVRKFIMFGVIFWPQDFFIFGIGMLVFILFVVVFTVAFGRVFCGWACPQTIFMEMVFRRVEYWIEGNPNNQKRLKNLPWNHEKILKKGGKHLVYFIISFIIANTFLAYITGIDELSRKISRPFSENAGTFFSLILFTGVFYSVYAWFREQVCLIVCPYGRLQSVMTDKNSFLVAYDYLRGEKRGKFKKQKSESAGDCIDCFQCVKVCPMGIDIRNGTQLECINCSACIDACDHMMESVGYPKGLIRFASENSIGKKEKLKFNGRIAAYTSVLVLLSGILVLLLATRKDVDATVLRTPGMLFQKQANGVISNLYNIRLINKTMEDVPVTLKLESGGEIKMIGKDIIIKGESKAESEFFVLLPETSLQGRKTEISIGLYSGDQKIETIETTFLGPVKFKP